MSDALTVPPQEQVMYAVIAEVAKGTIYYPYKQESAAGAPYGYGRLLFLDSERIRDRFDALAKRWTLDTMFLSSTDGLFSDASYSAIVKLGRPAVPLLLERLREPNPGFWHVALGRITGANPVGQSDKGSVAKIAAAWIAWGNDNHYT
jgi:hypothetical protein